MSNTITGTIKVIGTTSQVSDKFRKREIVITDNSNSQYPQHIIMQATQDRCSILDQFYVGDEVTVSFNLRGREWTSPQGEIKYFNTLEVWKIARNGVAKQAGPQSQAAQDFEQHVNRGATTAKNVDGTVPFSDLPF